MFDEFAATITVAGQKFHEMVTTFDKLEIRSHELKREEDACDASVEKIIKALDRTFITPFDREDVHTLATSMDDIMDNMEKTSYRLEVFRVEKPTPECVELARIIKECCVRVESAVKLLRDMRNSERIYSLIREIGQLENDADRVYRRADGALFAHLVASNGNGSQPITPMDVLALIKWREIYEWLEETVDACKQVANVISEIVIKGT
jgi:uncharacterized protein Yka (UPF0111/DUF47 family)